VRALRLAVFDSHQRIEPRTYDPEVPIRIVDIDESSLKELGQWPWPRTILSDLAMRLAENGAAAIAFDMPFDEPDGTSFEEIVRRLPKPQADLLTAATSGQTTNDQALVTRPDYALGPEQFIIAVLDLTLASCYLVCARPLRRSLDWLQSDPR